MISLAHTVYCVIIQILEKSVAGARMVQMLYFLYPCHLALASFLIDIAFMAIVQVFDQSPFSIVETKKWFRCFSTVRHCSYKCVKTVSNRDK